MCVCAGGGGRSILATRHSGSRMTQTEKVHRELSSHTQQWLNKHNTGTDRRTDRDRDLDM